MSRAKKKIRTKQMRNRINAKNHKKVSENKTRRKKAAISRIKRITAFRAKLMEKFQAELAKLYEEKTKESK